MTHRFQKSVADYASGATELVRQRIMGHLRTRHAVPHHLVLHRPILRCVFAEMAKQHGLPEPTEFRPGTNGVLLGVPFLVCSCGNDMGEDLIVRWDGLTEPL